MESTQAKAKSTRPKGLYIVRINFDSLYGPGTKPEGLIFSPARRLQDEELSFTWRSLNRSEIEGFLREKYLFSEQTGSNCGLIGGARKYFANPGCLFYLASMVVKPLKEGDRPPTLSENSMIVKENGIGKVFIPNISISKTLAEGKPVPHGTMDEVYASDSFLNWRLMIQYEISNPDSSLVHQEKTLRFLRFTKRYAAEIERRFKDTLKFGEDKRYLEGPSPDELLSDLTLDGEKFIPLEDRDLEVVYL